MERRNTQDWTTKNWATKNWATNDRPARRQPEDDAPPRGVNPRARARAFTLVELLVVIGIIALLIAILITVGAQVRRGAAADTTRNLIRVLETEVASVQTDTREGVPAWVRVPFDGTNEPAVPDVVPLVDGLVTPQSSGGPVRLDSTAWLLLHLQSTGSSTVLQTIDPKYLIEGDPLPGVTLPANTRYVTVQDAFGRPIRYVHPSFAGWISGDPRPRWESGGWSNATPPFGPVAVPGGYVPPVGTRSAVRNLRRVDVTDLGGADSSDLTRRADADGSVVTGDDPLFYSFGPDQRAGYVSQGAGAYRNDNADNVYARTPRMLPNLSEPRR